MRCTRHKLHMISYGCVGAALLSMGLVFSGFAIFKKDSEIAKVWLAGPTTMAVGMVLCGKVLIDCGTMAQRAMMEHEENCDEANFENINVSLGVPGSTPMPNTHIGTENSKIIHSIDHEYEKSKEDNRKLLKQIDTDMGSSISSPTKRENVTSPSVSVQVPPPPPADVEIAAFSAQDAGTKSCSGYTVTRAQRAIKKSSLRRAPEPMPAPSTDYLTAPYHCHRQHVDDAPSSQRWQRYTPSSSQASLGNSSIRSDIWSRRSQLDENTDTTRSLAVLSEGRRYVNGAPPQMQPRTNSALPLDSTPTCSTCTPSTPTTVIANPLTSGSEQPSPPRSPPYENTTSNAALQQCMSYMRTRPMIITNPAARPSTHCNGISTHGHHRSTASMHVNETSQMSADDQNIVRHASEMTLSPNIDGVRPRVKSDAPMSTSAQGTPLFRTRGSVKDRPSGQYSASSLDYARSLRLSNRRLRQLDDSPMLYQGEQFVLKDRQFFI